MGRLIVKTILGYIVIFVVVFALLSVAYVLVGADGAFEPASWDVSRVWIGITIVVGLVAGAVGGFIVAGAGGDQRAVGALAGFVFVLGLFLAIPALGEEGGAAMGPRPGTVGLFEAMGGAKPPGWITLLNPFLGLIGVLAGGRLRAAAGAASEG